MSLQAVGGRISGRIETRNNGISGKVNPAGGSIVVDAKWGEITGDIEDQEDLSLKIEREQPKPMSVAEIEKILYLG